MNLFVVLEGENGSKLEDFAISSCKNAHAL